MLGLLRFSIFSAPATLLLSQPPGPVSEHADWPDAPWMEQAYKRRETEVTTDEYSVKYRFWHRMATYTRDRFESEKKKKKKTFPIYGVQLCSLKDIKTNRWIKSEVIQCCWEGCIYFWMRVMKRSSNSSSWTFVFIWQYLLVCFGEMIVCGLSHV